MSDVSRPSLTRRRRWERRRTEMTDSNKGIRLLYVRFSGWGDMGVAVELRPHDPDRSISITRAEFSHA